MKSPPLAKPARNGAPEFVAGERRSPLRTSEIRLLTLVVIEVAIVIVVVPVLLIMPAAAVRVPPFVELVPATFSCFMQLMSTTISILAFGAILVNGDVQELVGTLDAPLAILFRFGVGAGRHGHERGEPEKDGNGQQQRLNRTGFPTDHLTAPWENAFLRESQALQSHPKLSKHEVGDDTVDSVLAASKKGSHFWQNRAEMGHSVLTPGLKPGLELRPDAALKGPLFHVGVPADQCVARKIKAARKFRAA
jgi:hypothetical protein